MKPSIKKAFLAIALIVLALLLVFALGLAPISLSWLRADVSDAVAEQFGLDFQVQGDLELRLGFHPTLSAAEVVLNNPAEDGLPLFSLDQLVVKPRIWALLKGDFLFRELSLAGVMLDYCQREFPTPKPESSSPGGPEKIPAIALDQFQVSDLRPHCSREDGRQDWVPDRLGLTGALPLDKPLTVDVQGIGKEREFLLSLTGDSLAELINRPERYPFSADLEVPDATELTLEAEIDSGSITVNRLQGTIAGISFLLSGRIENLMSRPYLEIDARAEQLDVAGLTALLEPADNSGREKMNLQPVYDVLSGFDAKLKVGIGQLLNLPLPVDELLVEASLQDRHLAMSGSVLVQQVTPVTARLSLDMQADCARLDSDLKATGLKLDEWNSLLGENSMLGGTLEEIRITTDSCGAAADAHLASLRSSLGVNGLAAQWNGEVLPLTVHSLESAIHWNEPGQLSLESSLFGEALSATGEFASLNAILSGSRWPFSMDLSALGSKLSLQGNTVLPEESRQLNLDIDLEIPELGTLQPWTGVEPEQELPLTGRVSLAVGNKRISISQLDLKLGTSDVRGELDWVWSKKDRSIRAELSSMQLDLVELDGLGSNNTEAVPAAAAETQSSLSPIEVIEKWLDLPPVEITLSADHIRGFLVDAEGARLHAKLENRTIEDAHLDFRIGDLRFDGALDADLRDRPWNMSLNSVLTDIDLGYLLSALGMKQEIDASASRATFQFISEGNSLRELVEDARTDSEIEELKWVFTTGPENQRHEVELALLDVSSTLSSTSTWQTSGLVNGVPFRAAMKTPPLRSTFGGSGPLPITLAISTGEDIVMLDANFDRQNSKFHGGNLSLSGKAGVSEETDLLQLEPPLADYEIKTQIGIREKELHFSSLEARTGSSLLKGDFRIRYEAPVYGFDLDLHSGFMETEDFVPWVAKWRESSGQPAGDSPAETEDEETQVGLFALITANIQKLAGNNRVKIKLAVDELHSAGELLGQTEFEMEIDGDEFRFDPISIGLPDGHVKASYTGQVNDTGYQYVLKTDVRNLNYGGLLRLLDAESEATGTLFLDINLESQAPDHEQIPQNLQGTVNLLAIPQNAEAGFLDLWASNLIFALLASQEETGKTMNCLVGLFDVNDGIMETKKTFLDTTDVLVRARGTIDLVQRELDLLVAPQSKMEKFFSVSAPITVNGPFDDFKVRVAPGGFMMTMVRWFYGVIYVPWKWLTGERFPADGLETCYNALPGLEP